MKNQVKELTEGMQRLCAVANRVVQSASPRRIDVDLLLENLRSLYDVALRMEEGALTEEGLKSEVGGMNPSTSDLRPPTSSEESPEGAVSSGTSGDSVRDNSDMAMMLTMAAMQQGLTESSVALTESPEVPEAPHPLPLPEEGKADVVGEPSGNFGDSVRDDCDSVRDSVEELEQNDNALLFDEVIIEPELSLTESPEEPEAPHPLPLPEEGKADAVGEPSGDSVRDGGDSVKAEGDSARAVQASLLDYLGQPAQRTLGESLGADRPQPSSLERKVDDLRTVININDKFSFMSELFHNNMKAYNDFIMSLNAMATRDEALAYVKEVASQQKWDDASTTVQGFYKIFDKKF